MRKNELRLKMREKRRLLSPENIAIMSSNIAQRLIETEEFKNARTVMVYISAFREVETRDIISELFKLSKKVVVPVTDTENDDIIPAYIDSLDMLSPGAYGILEPVSIKRADEDDIDLIILPGLAFDTECTRLGFGRGCFDRLLSRVSAKKIGLCYDFQLIEGIPHEEHDIPMDAVITERRFIRK